VANLPPADDGRDDASLDAWLGELRGGKDKTPASDAAANWDAAAVRRHVAAEAERDRSRADEEAENRLQSLLFAMRREGLLEKKTRPRFYIPLAIAASVLAGLLLIRPMLEPSTEFDEPPELRGAANVVLMEAADPKDRAKAIAAQLGKYDLAPRIYQEGRTYVVDVMVPPEVGEPLAAELKALGVAGGSGYVRLTIVPK